MKRIVSVFAFLALFSLCSVLHGEDTVDPDALIARVKGFYRKNADE